MNTESDFYTGLGLTLLVALLIGLGGIIGYELAPNMPVFDVRIYAPAPPDPHVVYGDYFKGLKDGVSIGRQEQYDYDVYWVKRYMNVH